MYSEKMVCAIKVGGKILREHSENNAQTVYIPFGSEYSFLLKNLSSGRRACVWITIDGKQAIDGGLVINPNQSIDLERFIEANQMNAGLKFKFIERTEKIENHRGIGLEDGLIKIEFEFECVRPTYYPPYLASNSFSDMKVKGIAQGTDGLRSTRRIQGDITGQSMNASYDAFSDSSWAAAAHDDGQFINYAASASMSVPKNDIGITVGGSISEQKFSETTFNGDGKKFDMIFKVKGAVGQEPIPEPVTVKTKQKCPSCGHNNKSGSKFCVECGTGLQVV